MPPLAHHAGEETLAPLLLLGGAWLSLLLAVGRARLAAARAWLSRVVGRDQALGRGLAPRLDQDSRSSASSTVASWMLTQPWSPT